MLTFHELDLACIAVAKMVTVCAPAKGLPASRAHEEYTDLYIKLDAMRNQARTGYR